MSGQNSDEADLVLVFDVEVVALVRWKYCAMPILKTVKTAMPMSNRVINQGRFKSFQTEDEDHLSYKFSASRTQQRLFLVVAPGVGLMLSSAYCS
jgi:hypothetical protein